MGINALTAACGPCCGDTFLFQVVHDFVYLRQEPSLHAAILGQRQRGDTFHASEETGMAG